MYHRKPAVAGAFYSAGKNDLERSVDSYIDNAELPGLEGDIVGLISPHAGYVYSGPIAACSFKAIKDSDFELAVVLAPSHRARFDGASVIPEGVYETPLGDVEIESEIGGKLMEKRGFNFLKEVHAVEHSLEVQVPFLQRTLGAFKIVPVIVGTTDLDRCGLIAEGLADILKEEKRKFIIVISTDLSHYYSYDSAVSKDGKFIESLKKFDEKGVKELLASGKSEACGEGPVLTGIMLCRELGAGSVSILKYGNSGDTAGDRSQVVGYLSAVFTR
jgi:AmmeMemoRadiSam system protein B